MSKRPKQLREPAPAPASPPTTFVDRHGREWRVRQTAGVVGRVRRELDITCRGCSGRRKNSAGFYSVGKKSWSVHLAGC